MRRVGILLALLSIAACSPVTPPSVTPSVGPTLVTSLTPTASCDRGTVAGGAGQVKEVMTAWSTCDDDRLRALMTEDAFAALKSVSTTRAMWTFALCDGAAGSSYCRYRNEIGSDMIFRVRNEPVARPVIEFRWDETVYDKSAEKYARNFVEAWINGNQPRMDALAALAPVAFAAGNEAPEPGYSIVLSPSEVWIFEVTDSAGHGYRIVLQGTLGKANAITALDRL